MPCEIATDQEEGDEDGYHLAHMVQRSDPNLVEELVAPQYLDRRPEDNDRRDRHTYVSTPLLASELLAKDEEEADEAPHPHGDSHRMALPEEARIVAKHQQQVASQEGSLAATDHFR